MSLSMEVVDDQLLLSEGSFLLRLSMAEATRIASLTAARTKSPPDQTVELDEHHVMWDHHSGGDRHGGDPWTLPGALDDASALLRHLPEMGAAFFELLLSQPGRLYTSQEIIDALPMFRSPSAVAGSLNGFVKPLKANGRPFPFYWWEGADGKPTRYAVRPSVAAVFLAAGG
jgi:hypothetical protein